MKTSIPLLMVPLYIPLLALGCGSDPAPTTPAALQSCDGGDCSADDASAAVPDSGGCEEAATYERPGPFVAGVITLQLDGVPVEVWYPADPGVEVGKSKDRYDMREWIPPDTAAKISDEDAPYHEMDAYRDIQVSTEGPFPVVLFSHGLGGYRTQSSFLMTHLATWGFVIAAPEHPERGLASVLSGSPLADDSSTALPKTLSLLDQENDRPGGALNVKLDLSKVAVSGHSMGGVATMVVATDDAIDAWFTLASPAPGEAPGKPLLMMGGAMDQIATPDVVKGGFDKKGSPKTYVSIDRAGHLAFTDICVIGKDRGGLFQIAKDYGVEVPDLLFTIGNDGCNDDNLPVAQAWPIINHYVTAHLRSALHMDDQTTGLEQATTACFDDVIAAFAHE